MSLFIKEHTVSFRSSQPREKILDLISDHFDSIGKSSIAPNGSIKVDASKFNNFMHDPTVMGTLTNRDDKYTITMTSETNPKWAVIIPLIICTCGLGIIPTVFFVILPDMRTSTYYMAALEKIQRDAV